MLAPFSRYNSACTESDEHVHVLPFEIYKMEKITAKKLDTDDLGIF